MAHVLIQALSESLARDCLPLFTSDGLTLYFYAPRGSLWPVALSESSRAQRAPLAGGGRPDLRPGEKCCRRRKLLGVTHVMRLGTEAALAAGLQGSGLSGRLNM